MLRTTTNHNVCLKVRESSKHAPYTSYNALLNRMTWLSDYLNLYDCEVTTSLIKYPSYNEWGDVEDLGLSRYYLTVNGELPLSQQVETIVHEFVHISQMKHGILRCRSNGDVVWRGCVYRYKDKGKMSFNKKLIRYENFPWEVDVAEKETDIMKKLAKKY